MEVLGICVRKSKGPGTFTFIMCLYFASVFIDQGLQARSKVYVCKYVPPEPLILDLPVIIASDFDLLFSLSKYLCMCVVSTVFLIIL